MHILNFDRELKEKTSAHVDEVNRSIDWNKIVAQDFKSAHRTVILWAYSIYNDVPYNNELFTSAMIMDASLRRAVVQSLAIRWTLPIEQMNNLICA